MSETESLLLGEVDRVDVVSLCSDLVRIQSHRDHAGHETPCAEHICTLLKREGIGAYLQEVRDQRCNVIGVLPGSGRGTTLMFNGHLDTFPPGDMPSPFKPRIVDGNLTGRGSVDMKGGIAGQLAAMIALKRLGIPLAGDLVFSGVIAEEDSASLGALHVIEHGPRADMVVVSEPTDLTTVIAHKGFDHYRIDIQGRACHSSDPGRGVSAVYKGAKIVNAIENCFIKKSCSRTHPLLGPASFNVAAILGYARNEASTVLRCQPAIRPPGAVVPDICTIYIDRRRVPGESLDDILRGLQAFLDEMRRDDPELNASASHTPGCVELPSHPPLDTSPDHVLVRESLRLSAKHAGSPATPSGAPFWCDAALFNNLGGVPAIVYGPGRVQFAHSNQEHVPVEQLKTAAHVYALLATSLLTASQEPLSV